ncbi:MAG TPA: 2-C-methyl-D-erythritol 4-phosphate cytidylyltransferase [Quisquiliibacterium sp.]|nr:2-C-methyl-D-erythritol 4-phosphate cytidylyltransferase [Quisquiliibacterium sp.]
MSPSRSHSAPARPRFFAVVPAAGVGARLGAALPKQYLEISGVTLLAWSLRPLLQASWIEHVLVVVAPGDERAGPACTALAAAHGARLGIARVGGATRRDSVLAGLLELARSRRCGDDDWVLVHDAARPGLGAAALERLRDRLMAHPVGGLLSLPVADTVKRADARGEVAATIAREGLWLAQTPQMFRFGALREALQRHPEVTDEAAAMEAEGAQVLLVEGERRNFKVTTAEDLELMAAMLSGGQAGEHGDER